MILMALMLLIPLILKENNRSKITGQTGNGGIINVEIMVPLKYLSNFWRTLEMPLINCEVKLILNWSASYCKSSSYIYINRNKSLCSCRYFINSR